MPKPDRNYRINILSDDMKSCVTFYSNSWLPTGDGAIQISGDVLRESPDGEFATISTVIVSGKVIEITHKEKW